MLRPITMRENLRQVVTLRPILTPRENNEDTFGGLTPEDSPTMIGAHIINWAKGGGSGTPVGFVPAIDRNWPDPGPVSCIASVFG